MKKLLSILAVSAVISFYSVESIAQLPAAASTKITKIARNASGQIFANGTITVKLTVTDGTNTYTETFATVPVNNLGFFTLTVGSGANKIGTLGSIVLNNDTKITTEVSLDGGTNYQKISENKYLDVAAETQAFGLGMSGQVLTIDGVGGTSWTTPGLTSLTESSFGNGSTINYGSKLSAKNNAQTNVDLVISPKGNGAVLADQPDGEDMGGNKRGIFAVDLQMSRTVNTQVANGWYATISGGQNNTASGNSSAVGGGIGNTASGNYSTTAGNANTASGNYSTVGGGSDNQANGNYSTVGGGLSNFAQSLYSTVGGGSANQATGNYSTVTGGLSNIAQSYGETILGIFSTVGSGTADSYVATDRLLVVGNGTTTNARSNALTILKNANTTIGGSLTINGNATDASITFPIGRGTSGQFLKTNADGTTAWVSPSGLTNFTESRNTTSPNDTKPAHVLAASGSDTDLDMVITPKGSGALLADLPDGAITGGNKRGTYAVDLQMVRENAAQVASGNSAAIGGGEYNTASGFASTISGGGFNNASNSYSTVGGGYGNTASGGRSTVSAGTNNTASGWYSTVAGGGYNNATAYYSFAVGIRNTAQSYGETAMGLFSTVEAGTVDSYVPTERLFVIGNGIDQNYRSNALTILKNGNTTIAGKLTLGMETWSTSGDLSAATKSVIKYTKSADITALPTASGNAGTKIIIINAQSNNITIKGYVGAPFDGYNFTMNTALEFICDGTGWYLIN